MLGEHVDGVVAGDAVVEVPAQTYKEVLEGVGHVEVRIEEQGFDASGVAFGDVGDVLGPVFPVATVADLFDDLGVDGVAPLPDLREVQHRLYRRTLGAALDVALEPGDTDYLELVALGLVQVDLVDHGVEAVVVGTQGL